MDPIGHGSMCAAIAAGSRRVGGRYDVIRPFDCNRHALIHPRTVADLYIVLFDGILNNPDKTGHGWEGFYFGENGEHTWYQISQAIGEALVKLGIADDATPTTFTVEELVKYFGSEKWGWYSGTNSRCRANRGRSIGWKPTHTTEDMLKSLLPEIEAIWRKMKEDRV